MLFLTLALFVHGVSGATVLHAHSTNTNAKGSSGQKTEGSVIQKVIEMLQENKIKVIDDLKQEEQEMTEYNQFCDDELDSLAYAVKTSTRKISDLSAEVDDAAAQIRSLDDEIALTSREVAAKDQELMDAKQVRSKDRDNFEKMEKEMLTSVEALEKAIVLVKRSQAGFLQIQEGKPSRKKVRKFGRALAKALGPIINAAWVDKGSKAILDGFLQDRDQSTAKEDEDDDLELKAPAKKSEAAEATGGILQTLEDMKEKASETLSTSRMEEMKANHNYEVMVASLEGAINLMQKKISDSKATKAALTETQGKAAGEMASAKKTKLQDSMTSERLKGECEIAQTEWVERQKTAKGEIAAIDKAKAILTDRVKVLLSQYDDPYESQEDSKDAAQRRRLVDKLQTLGHKFKSYAMMEMASAAAEDPFTKIRGLVEEMISKLVAAAQEEATQKAFCDDEKAKSKKEQEAKTLRFDDLKSRLDSAAAMKGQLEEQIKELHSEIAETDKAMEEASTIRTENHNTYLKTKKDFTEGAAAVEEAIRVLKEYYASQAASFVQQAQHVIKGRPAFGGIQNDAAQAIIAILENSASEFARMVTEVEQEEQEYVTKFKERDATLKSSKKAKQDEIQSAESEIKVLNVQMEGDQEDIKMVSKELDAVMEYLDKLKPQCETKAMTYEEKKAKREEEIEGLKEALAILDAPSLVQTPVANNIKVISNH